MPDLATWPKLMRPRSIVTLLARGERLPADEARDRDRNADIHW
jgi:hypothetical protein